MAGVILPMGFLVVSDVLVSVSSHPGGSSVQVSLVAILFGPSPGASVKKRA